MNRSTRLYGIFDFGDPQDAERALRHFIHSVESGWPISPELLEFIANGIKIHYKKGDVSAWTKRKTGRPKSIQDNDYLSMLAWYRFHLDPKFNSLPKTTGGGRYSIIADSFNDSSNQEVINAAKLSERINGVRDIDSETGIKRAVIQFQKSGLHNTTTPGLNMQDLTQIEVFCKLILYLPSNETITTCTQNIIECWNKNKKVHKQN